MCLILPRQSLSEDALLATARIAIGTVARPTRRFGAGRREDFGLVGCPPLCVPLGFCAAYIAHSSHARHMCVTRYHAGALLTAVDDAFFPPFPEFAGKCQ